MLTTTDARDTILQQIQRLGSERVSIVDAIGRFSAEEIRALRQQPPWDNSAMDGFAVRATDTATASQETPARLTIIEDLMAGVVPQKEVTEGKASRIMTGAPLPPGADAVVRVEDTRPAGEDIVEVLTPVEEGRDVRWAGEDQQIGDLLLEPGKMIRSAEVGVLAGAPRSFVRVFRVPTVGIIATGDELAEPDETPLDGQIINTSAYSLAAMVKEAGAIPRILPIARDSREDLARIFEQARGLDAIVSIGGVSVGEHDFVKEVLASLGVEMKFWKVRMTPGKPLAFGMWGPTPVFGLPGNPVSCMVSFELFVRPALLKMAGHKKCFRRALRARLTETISKRPDFVHFLRVTLRLEEGRWLATSTGAQGSGILHSMSRADGLAVGDRDLQQLEAGSEVWVLPLNDQWSMTEERPV